MAKESSKNVTADPIRLDRWLWAARFFKTRSVATEAIKGGHVHLNGQRVKPAKAVTIGDRLEIRKGELRFVVDVIDLSGKRGSATIAQGLYTETQESIESREAEQEKRRLQRAVGGHLSTDGRPDKKQRRLLHRFKQAHDDGA